MDTHFKVSAAVVGSEAFVSLPPSAQALYFHLLAYADRSGFLNNAKSVAKGCGASDDDLLTLIPAFVRYREHKIKRVGLLLKPSLYESLKEQSEETGISINELINRAIETAFPMTKEEAKTIAVNCCDDPALGGYEIVHWHMHTQAATQNEGRRTYDYTLWRKAVKLRDGFRCVMCGSSEHLEAHHIKPFSKFPEGRTDVNNGITLCHSCHAAYHASARAKKKVGAE